MPKLQLQGAISHRDCLPRTWAPVYMLGLMKLAQPAMHLQSSPPPPPPQRRAPCSGLDKGVALIRPGLTVTPNRLTGEVGGGGGS